MKRVMFCIVQLNKNLREIIVHGLVWFTRLLLGICHAIQESRCEKQVLGDAQFD